MAVPYFTRLCEASSVVHVMVAEPVVIEDAATLVITGGVVSARGANTEKCVVFPDTVLFWVFTLEFSVIFHAAVVVL